MKSIIIVLVSLAFVPLALLWYSVNHEPEYIPEHIVKEKSFQRLLAAGAPIHTDKEMSLMSVEELEQNVAEWEAYNLNKGFILGQTSILHTMLRWFMIAFFIITLVSTVLNLNKTDWAWKGGLMAWIFGMPKRAMMLGVVWLFSYFISWILNGIVNLMVSTPSHRTVLEMWAG